MAMSWWLEQFLLPMYFLPFPPSLDSSFLVVCDAFLPSLRTTL